MPACCQRNQLVNQTAIVGNVNLESIIRANSLNQLATATGNYPMGTNILTGLGAGVNSGDSVSVGQTAPLAGVNVTDGTAADGEVQLIANAVGTGLNIFKNTADTQPVFGISWSNFLSTFAFALGPGGSTITDTLLSRAAAGVFKLSNAVQLAGLTGATATGRWVGQTTGGAPTSGTFNTGDWITTTTGQVLICSAGGTSGTWARANQKSLVTNAPGATPAINVNTTDIATFTGLATTITSMTTNLTGTPVEGQKLIVKLTGTGSTGITWGASFASTTIALPTTTSGTATLHVGFIYDAASTTWKCVGVA